ncbi:MAG: hypothetical protein B7Z23_10410 [Pseudomonadales bacterium 32-61-5]|nr:MAG: hypothetical protein B7Z23_10410 [Pseudomonadales bacterium 32-61-5]
MTNNTFAIIEADYPHEVILRFIGSTPVSGDGQVGTEVPNPYVPPRGRITAFKNDDRPFTTPSFWGSRKLFSLWDGKPVRFNYCD